MKRIPKVLCLCCAAAAAAVLAWSPSGAAPASLPRADEPVPEIVEESMHEFMEYVFQPAYKRLKTAMATAPADNAGWKAIKADSLTLAESCNLLFSRAPEDDRSDWLSYAAASRKHGADLYRAAREKNFESASTAYRTMLESCNSCHRQFEDGRHILKP